MAAILPILGGVFGVAAKFGEYLVPPVKRQFSYMFHYNSNIENLIVQSEKLENTRVGVQLLVDAAKRNLEVIGPDVEDWLKKVDEVKSEISRFLEEVSGAQKDCLNGLSPNLRSRYSLGRKAKKMSEVVLQLQGAGKFERVSYPAPPVGMDFATIGNGEEFKSRILTEEAIMVALKDDNADIIGIYGMGGVGKTRMAKRIGERVQEEFIFDEVVMAVVTQQPDVRKIQCEIGELLGLKLIEESSLVRARRLGTRLKDIKKILIILDDLWGRLDLQELGIPTGHTHKGCKILFTSRNRDVCIEMNAEKNTFMICLLSPEEAWSLFKQASCYSGDRDNFYPIAMQVAEECKGLPIALVTVGKALKGKSLPFWEDALVQLKKALPINIPGVIKDVYRPLEFSYTNLESDEAKSLFLICCLFREDFNIPLEDLIRYGMGLYMFEGVEDLEEARNRVHVVVEILKDRCLLVEADDKMAVKMHDVIRDVAIYIASVDNRTLMVSHNANLKAWPRRRGYENYTFISVISDAISELPTGLNCPNLELLQLQCKNQSLEAPNNFFDGMKKLKVLDMRYMHISSIPSSVQLLMNLQTLQLTYFPELDNISIIGKLVDLEILSFRGSLIEELPKELGALTNLRLLDLNMCRKLKKIAPGVIQNLVRLEEVYVRSSFCNWEAERDEKERKNAALIELETLTNLTTLEIEIPYPEVIPKNMGSFTNLKRYSLSIYNSAKGERKDEYIKIGNFEKLIGLSLPTISPLDDGIKMLLKSTEILHLRGNGAKNVMTELVPAGFQHIKDLQIHNCDFLENLGSTMDCMPPLGGVFPVLESLNLRSVGRLKEICHGQLPEGSFQELRHMKLVDLPLLMQLWRGPTQDIGLTNLKSIYVNNSDSLESLFSMSTAQGLAQLEKLQIINCKMIREVFSVESRQNGSASNKIRFSKLSFLKFQNLPSLTSFCNGIDGIEFPQLSNLDIYDLERLKNFFPMESNLSSEYIQNPDSECVFNQNVTYPRLKRARFCKLDTVSRIWCHKFSSDFFSELEILEVEFVSNLEMLFSPSAARALLRLQKLKIRGCPAMEYVIGYNAEGQMMTNEALFPQLKRLELRELPKLRCFCHINYVVELPSMEELIINGCPVMEVFSATQKLVTTSEYLGRTNEISGVSDFSYNMRCFFFKVSFARLRRLELCALNYVKEMWCSEIQDGFLRELEVLVVKSCSNLRNLFPPSVARFLINLKELEISDCRTMIEVIAKEEEEEEQGKREINVPLFPQLEHLQLKDLHRLRSFCHMKYAVELPSLNHLNIEICYDMRTFSPGDISMPKLKCIHDNYRTIETTDINSTLCELFNKHEEQSLQWLREAWTPILNRPPPCRNLGL